MNVFSWLFREGTLKIGDRVIAINGINVSNAALEDAMGILHQSELETILVVEYDVSIMGRYQRETRPPS